ncbi:MAG: BlaI family penicillinase repressor [Verrucomicrobiales bacterium]|jgi:BlaI family penicillinase repressor
MKKADLTDAEWKVMKIVWELETCSARDVYTIGGERYEWAPTTVKTYLSFLVNKGYLSAKKKGNSFIYKPKRSLISTLQRAGDHLLEKTLDGADGPLLAYLVKRSQLSKADLTEIRQVLDEHEKRHSAEE